jgi:thioredoxin reductase (NADPH)
VKRTYSAFASTRLAEELRTHGVRTVVIVGTQTDKCVVANALAAFDLGFDVLVATDACAARSEERHREALRLIERSCAVLASSRDLCSGVRKAGSRVPDSPPRAFDADLLIAGAGPAGLAAFIQARREGLDPVVVEPSAPGGALRAGRRIENYPGVPAIAGPALADRMVRQAESAGLAVLRDRVTGLTEGEAGWRVTLGSGRELRVGAVILATGQTPVVPPIFEPLRAVGALLVPGAFAPEDWRGRRVVVVGGGDTAFDQALLLADHGAIPTVVCRSEPRALPALRAEAAERAIPVRPRFAPASSLAGPPAAVTFFGREASSAWTMDTDAVLAAVGKEPSWPEVIFGCGERLDWSVQRSADPLPPGLFLAGDVGRGDLRQAAVAVGDGCAAAIAARRYLQQIASGGGI